MENYHIADNSISIRKLRFVYSLIYTAVLLLVLIGSLALIYRFNQKINNVELADEQFAELDVMENEILTSLELAVVPINLFDSGEFVESFYLDPSSNMCIHLELFFETFIKNYSQFNQMRFLDVSGQEVLRVDNTDGHAKIVALEDLQYKGDRCYFADAMELDADTIYVSKFDLDIENGVVEEPHGPMIRLAKKVMSKEDETLGAIIVDFQGSELLEAVENKNQHEGDEVFVVNSNGYNLLTPSKESDYGFMFINQIDENFFNQQKAIWNQIENGEKEIITEGGNYYIRPFHLLDKELMKNTSGTLYLIMKVPPENLNNKSKGLITSIQYATIIFAPFFLFIGVRLGFAHANQRWYQNELIKNASIDAMTGLFNRRSIFYFLNHHIEQQKRTDYNIAVAFMDINNLKMMNDEYGHDKGDEMIISFSDIIKNNFRKSDLLSRIGGDEFLIIFLNSSEEGFRHSLENAFEQFKKKGIENVGIPYEFSYGITSYIKGESIDKLIDRADNLMYIDKRKKKNKPPE